MFARRQVTALVAGAGPVGLFTALSLARRGQSVRIIDRGVRTNFESFALALHPMSLSLLEGLGLADEALALGLRVPRILMDGFDEVAWSVEFRETSARFPFLLILPQGPFEGLLVRALRAEGVEVEWNRRLAGFDERHGELFCHVEHLAEQALGYAVSGMSRLRVGESRIEAKYLIGTDGAWSTVRRELGIAWKTTGPKRTFEVYEFPVLDSRGIQARVFHNAHGLGAQWPLPGNRMRLTFETEPGNEGEVGLDNLRARCERNLIGIDLPDTLFWSSPVEFEPGHAEALGRGHCWLAGDSAHRTLPHGIQSMNAGLTEGALLASRIADASDQLAAATRFDDYATGRLEEWKYLLGTNQHPPEQERRAVVPATGRLHHQLMEQWRRSAVATAHS